VAAMTAFLGVLYLATTPLRRRQERALRALGLDRHGRPLAEDVEDVGDPQVTAEGPGS